MTLLFEAPFQSYASTFGNIFTMVAILFRLCANICDMDLKCGCGGVGMAGAIGTGAAGGDDDNDDIADEDEPNAHHQMDHLSYMPDKEALDSQKCPDADSDMVSEQPGQIGTSTGDN